MVKISSTKRLKKSGLCNVKKLFSRIKMYKLAIEGAHLDPMATPFICLYILLL